MVMKLYCDDKSAQCRGVLLTLKALNLTTLEVVEVDPLYKDDAELVKVNPQKTVPTLVDDDVVLVDSHVISGYLVSKYTKDSTLYPTDEQTRALVEQRLRFNSNVLLPSLYNILTPIITLGEKEISKGKLDAVKEGYHLLNKFLGQNQFLAGDASTIADLSCVASVSTCSVILPISAEIYPNLFKWYHKCKSLPYYEEANGIGLKKMDALIESKLRSAYTKSV